MRSTEDIRERVSRELFEKFFSSTFTIEERSEGARSACNLYNKIHYALDQEWNVWKEQPNLTFPIASNTLLGCL